MAKSEKPQEFFWGADEGVGDESIHLIEYSAYEKLQQRVEELEKACIRLESRRSFVEGELMWQKESLISKLAKAIEYLKKTPCTGNGLDHLKSCFKCAKVAELEGE